jgi:hypothetical protein
MSDYQNGTEGRVARGGHYRLRRNKKTSSHNSRRTSNRGPGSSRGQPAVGLKIKATDHEQERPETRLHLASEWFRRFLTVAISLLLRRGREICVFGLRPFIRNETSGRSTVLDSGGPPPPVLWA